MDNNYSFSKKFLEGEAISNFWNLASYGIISLNSFIIIYFLSVYEYGLYQLILSVIAMAVSVAGGAFDGLVSVDLSRYFGRGDTASAKRLFWEYAALKFFLMVLQVAVLIIGANLISNYGLASAKFLRPASIAVVLLSGQSLINTFFKSKIYFSALKSSFVGEIGKFFVIIGFLFWQGLDIENVLIVYVVGQSFSFVFSTIYFIKLYDKIFSEVQAVKKFLLKDLMKIHGIWIFWRYLLSRIGNNIRPWILRIFLSTEAVGFYSFARNLVAIIVRLLPLGTLGILFPRETENKEKFRYIFIRVIKYSLFLSTSLSILAFFIVPSLLSRFLPKYNPAMPLFKIMIGIIFLYGFYKILRMVLVVFQEQKALAIRSFDESILAPLILVFLLPVFGITGAAIEWVLTYFITTILFYVYISRKHVFLHLRPRDILKIDKHDYELFKKIYKMTVDFFKKKCFPILK